jgi:transposase
MAGAARLMETASDRELGDGPKPISFDNLIAAGVPQALALGCLATDIRGLSADEWRLVRQQKSGPLVDALEPWLRAKLVLISQKSKFAVAIRYVAMGRPHTLHRRRRYRTREQHCERSIRPIALTRMNALFAGSDGGAKHWATIASELWG